MYLFRLIIVFALLTFDLSSHTDLITPTAISNEIAEIDLCLLGSWRVDIESMSRTLDRPVSGSILITFEESPVNEVTASFDVVISRRPPETQRKEHKGSLSGTIKQIEAEDGRIIGFELLRLEFGSENSHKRYKSSGEWRDITERTKQFLLMGKYFYKDCTSETMIGMTGIVLNKETY